MTPDGNQKLTIPHSLHTSCCRLFAFLADCFWRWMRSAYSYWGWNSELSLLAIFASKNLHRFEPTCRSDMKSPPPAGSKSFVTQPNSHKWTTTDSHTLSPSTPGLTAVSRTVTCETDESELRCDSVEMTGLVCCYSKHCKPEAHSIKLSHLGTPRRVAQQPRLIVSAAGWFNKCLFFSWADDICGVSLFANSFKLWFISLRRLSVSVLVICMTCRMRFIQYFISKHTDATKYSINGDRDFSAGW